MHLHLRNVVALFLAMVLFPTLPGCHAPSASPGNGRLSVAVSIIPDAWLARAVGGERLDVVTLVPPGESHHTYQPTDAQVTRVMSSAVFFRAGTSFENAPWFQALRTSGKPRVVDLRDGVPLIEMEEDEHDHAGEAHGHKCTEDGKDPHIWLSPRRLKIQAATIARTLAELDPTHRAEYDRHLAAVTRQLDELDRAIAAKLAPLKGKAFLVFHPAWGYFAADYGIRQLAVEVEGKEPSDRALTELEKQARAAGVKVVFVQPQFGGRAARAVAQATGARLEIADPLPADLPSGLLKFADAIAASYQ
jgi:zinc transport system substrate-binding protein